MSLDGHVFAATNGLHGLDLNRPLTGEEAAALAEHGYDFAIRYVRRKSKHSYDLAAKEARAILAAGLGLMVVQHVAPDGWSPTANLGSTYGNTAAGEAARIGVPPGVTVWCDLEGVSPDAPTKAVIDFCNRWHSKVAAAGFVPGLYVGFGAGLDADQLYWSLRFTHYWVAYNVTASDGPTKRGFQMKQGVANAADRVASFDAEFQVDDIHADALGGLPTMLVAESWL
jgi:hypothetical protein